MNIFCYDKKLQYLCSGLCGVSRPKWFKFTSFRVQLCYFLALSFVCFGFLKGLKPRTGDSYTPRDVDYFFTSVSAATVSSMSTVEMEVFSDSQLIVLTFLMFLGGEVFVSMVGLQLVKLQLKTENKIAHVGSEPSFPHQEIELMDRDRVTDTDTVVVVVTTSAAADSRNLQTTGTNQPESSPSPSPLLLSSSSSVGTSSSNLLLKYKSIEFLGFVVLGYLAVNIVLGTALVSVYIAQVSSARNILIKKGLKVFTFCVFTTVSTFANCGFVPTNENMAVFRKNSGLLLILIPQILFGNALFPPCLRFCAWFLGRFFKKAESNYLLKNNTGEIFGYRDLLPALHSKLLAVTAIGLVLLQFPLFCAMEWNSDSLDGLNTPQKIIGALFQVTNSRHTGESIVDLSTVSSPLIVLFVVMMYLPPYTSFLPVKVDDQRDESRTKRKRKAKLFENLICSQLSYLVIFIILICITERKKMKDDPLNFNVLNVVVEVISAYGNVGFSTGYSCKRQLNPDQYCQDKAYGFSGKWSDGGKIILIVVMLFGRLKKFNMDGGKAWLLI